MNGTEKSKAYEKLTPERKALVERILENLEKGDGLWQQGWVNTGVPESAVTGKQYRGINNLFLSFAAMAKGYRDNRWITFKQMEEKGWKFKTDEEGNSLGKGAGVAIEFFELRDRETKKSFDRKVLDGMTVEEQQDYMRDNVYPIRKYYRVFNGDIVDGIPEREAHVINSEDVNERAERIIDYWDENESQIVYGGGQAYYSIKTDKIHIPVREDFKDMQAYYSTLMHEIGHSTGHETRLNRSIANTFGSPDYAKEELRAEIASIFLAQDLGLEISDDNLNNNAQYVKSWMEEITEDPNVLFTAISDADKISQYVIGREKESERLKNTEYFSVVESENELGEAEYKVYVTGEYGQVTTAIAYNFSSRDELMKEFDNYKSAPFWKDKHFEEVGFEQLISISQEKAKAKDGIEGGTLISPAEKVARAMPEHVAIDMSERGIDSLVRMADRDVVEKASATKTGEKFIKLYGGESVFGNAESDARSLMTRIAMFCDGDTEQLLRVFKSSGQFHDENPNAFYEKMAKESIDFITKIRDERPKAAMADKGKEVKGLSRANAKA